MHTLKMSSGLNMLTCNDDDAVNAFLFLCKYEGIIPALESSHALSYAIKIAKKLDSTHIVVVTLSGRGDKDMDIIMNYAKARNSKHEKAPYENQKESDLSVIN